MTIILIIAVVLFAFWLLGLTTRFTESGLIHVALVIALVLLIIWLMRAVVHAF